MRRRLVLLLLLAAGCGPASGARRERVIIPDGASVRAAADSLAAHGIIESKFWFRLVSRIGGYDRRLRSGNYELARGTGSLGALRALASGRASLVHLTVPEGFTLLDIADLVQSELKVDRDSFLTAARDPELLQEFGVPAPSFEGFLRPDTYYFAAGVPARAVLREMATTFRSSWDPAWDAQAAAQQLDRLGVVTLASIIEGEARVDPDRPLIAAVYRNRLRLGMPLQADPTVQYAIQRSTGERKPRLYEKDYEIESLYNTYLKAGLPPGPIGAPGRRSIEAALAPAPVPYLYFVAGPDGRHIFSRTYSEHLRAVARMRR
jgi:UPF0755 protein